jgi:hypothetical protein
MESHIIPAFVARWMKETAATPYLRSPVAPNIPRQDVQKVRLLCEDCEGLFSRSEKVFAEKLFIPYHENGVRTFEYDTWLLHFAVSLVWRAAVKEGELMRRDYPDRANKIEAAARVWRDFLLGKTGNTGRYAHHLLFWDPKLMKLTVPEGGKLPEHFFWYVMRHVDSVTVYSEKKNVLYAYAKLPQMFFWSGIQPANPTGFKRTVIKRKGTISHSQTVKNSDFTGFIAGRVREYRARMDTMSDKQRDKISQLALADPEKTINSGSFEAHLIEQAYRESLE